VVDVDVLDVEVEVLDVLVDVLDVLVETLVEVDVEVELDVLVDVPYTGLSLTDVATMLWYQYTTVKKVEPSGTVDGVTVLASTTVPFNVDAEGANCNVGDMPSMAVS
jgi:hypothetical protein